MALAAYAIERHDIFQSSRDVYDNYVGPAQRARAGRHPQLYRDNGD